MNYAIKIMNYETGWSVYFSGWNMDKDYHSHPEFTSDAQKAEILTDINDTMSITETVIEHFGNTKQYRVTMVPVKMQLGYDDTLAKISSNLEAIYRLSHSIDNKVNELLGNEVTA